MHRVLIIEKSDTRRHVLRKLLVNRGYDIVITRDFASALSLLFSGENNANPVYDAFIFGWPEYNDPDADEFLDLLLSPKFTPLPVLILTDRYDPSKRDFVTRRARTAMLSWEDYSDALDSLSKLIAPDVTTVRVARANADPQAGEIRILFVDDSPTIRVAYRRLLTRSGYITETANSVADALDKIGRQDFEIVITDYFMPDANGDELCRQLRNNPALSELGIAIITGTYLDKVIKDSLDAGATECMFKNEADELFLARVAAMSRTVQIQKSINKDRRRLEGILCSVGEGVYGVDTAGLITFMNPIAKKILGLLPQEDMVGKLAHDLFHYATPEGHPIPKEQSFLQQAYNNGGEIQNCETVYWHASGKAVLVECTVVPLHISGQLAGAVAAFSDISKRKLLEEELVWQANHDSLTKLHNRHYFEKQLEAEVLQLRRNNQLSALMYLDLDRFKYINDTAGHTAGDRLLIEVSRLLKERIRESDLLARLGGDEFAIILRNIERDKILTVSDSIRELLNGYMFGYNGKNYQVNCSIGIACLEKKTISPEEALANADLACNIAKRQGRNQAHIYSPESDEKIAMGLDLGWSVRLREALAKNLFIVHYQPIVALADIDERDCPNESGKLWDHILNNLPNMQHHYEVLIRMRTPDGEIIHPNAFLPTAERFNMMPEVDRWVVAHALKELRKAAVRRPDTVFAINLSGHSVGDQTLLPYIKSLIAEHKINPGSLIFEITETAAIANMTEARRFIQELSHLGCRFALDDFGSGFSSFSQLKHLNVEFIKIDGQFIQGMANNSVDRSIVSSINDIAHALGKRTVAEYVQNVESLRMLKECGVDFVQGYYISQPYAELGDLPLPAYTGNVIKLAVSPYTGS